MDHNYKISIRVDVKISHDKILFKRIIITGIIKDNSEMQCLMHIYIYIYIFKTNVTHSSVASLKIITEACTVLKNCEII
jgi:hypothetical protein